MIDTAHTDENSSATDTGPLYDYIHLGIDGFGNEHVYRTEDQWVFVFDETGEPIERWSLEDKSLHDYEEAIRNDRGWFDYHPSVDAEFGDPFWMFREGGE